VYIKIPKARKDCTCGLSNCTEGNIIKSGDKYINLRARVAPYMFITTKYHIPCFYVKLLEMAFFRKPRRTRKTGKDMGRPRLKIIGTKVENYQLSVTKTPLTPEQLKRRAVLRALYSRYKKKGGDVSALFREMEQLGGVPVSWKESSNSIESGLTIKDEVG